MTRRLAWVLAPMLLACAPSDDIRARYDLERRLWSAQFFQRRVNIAFMQASRNDTRLAIEGYQRVLAADPLGDPRAASWRPPVVADIRQILLSSRVALASLYFLSEQYADAGALYRETVETGALPLESALEARLGAARSMYMTGESSAALEQCAQMFQAISTSPDFWAGKIELDEVFLRIPIVLVRMYRENGPPERYDEYTKLADDFYARVASTWPESWMATDARLGRIQLHLVREQWADAARELNIVTADGTDAPDAAGLLLLLGEVHAFAIGDTAAAAPVFQRVMQQYPDSDAAFAARFDTIEMRRKAGDAEGALSAFRALEDAPGVPDAVASRAMLTRARILEARGDWDDALALLRRLQQIYPFSPAAIEAPMFAVRHYLDRGEISLAERTLEKAREYYLGLIDRNSQFTGDRLTVQGALAESYVMSGKAGDVAQLLASAAPQWDDDATASGLLRAGELYATNLADPEAAAAMFKKCIEQFPETRYARVAQHRLDEIEGRR